MIDRKTVLKEAGTDENMLTSVETTLSTNLLARELADSGAPSGTAVLAEAQTGGRGRMGRSFWSPDGSGLYLSVVIRPGENSDSLLPGSFSGPDGLMSLLTVTAGVCVSDSIGELFGVRAGLKWVNDIIIGGRKAGGILTEGRFEAGLPLYAVIGIGVNIYPPAGGFPAELSGIAGSVLTARLDPEAVNSPYRERLAGRIIRKLTETAAKFEADPVNVRGSLYKSYSERINWMFGREIDVRSPSGAILYTAEAAGLTEDFGLTVKTPDGGEHTLRSGEVSVRVRSVR